MRVPGGNLLKSARRLIKFESVQYFQTTGREKNAARQYVGTYAAGVPLSCSVQSVDRAKYTQLGLSLEKFYVQVWASMNMVDIQRDSSGDQFIYDGALYQLADGRTWFKQDGWASCFAVRIKIGATGPGQV
jgi:hypothetical protein